MERTNESKRSTHCSVCGHTGHNRQNCSERLRLVSMSKGKRRETKAPYCGVCWGLSHRRVKSPCACGELYVPLPTISVRDAMEGPGDDRRTFPP